MIQSMRVAELRPLHVAAVSLFVVVALAASAWIARPLFLSIGAIGLLVVAYAAYRWPRTMLVVSSLAVLADPVLIPSILPESMTFGPIGASEPMLAVTSLVIVGKSLRSGAFISALRDPIVPLGVLFVLACGASAVFNGTPLRTAALGVIMTVDAMVIYVVARMTSNDRQSVGRAIAAVVGVAFAASILGIAQVVLHPDLLGFASFAGRFGEGGRITSFLGNPNMVAVVVGFVLPYPLLASRRLPSRRHRQVAFGVVVIFCLTLLLTFSRGAWLAVALGMLLGLVFIDRRALLTLLAAVVLAWGASIVLPRNLLVSEADLQLYFPDSGAPSILDSTLDRLDEVYEKRDLRMRFIREGLPIVLDHPVLGVGPGRYGGAAATIIPSPVYGEYGTGLYGFRTVHNFWLHLVGEVGALGTAVFLTIIVGLIIRFVRAARRERDPVSHMLTAGTALALVVVTVNNSTEMIFEGNFPGFVIWLVAGLVSSIAPRTSLFDRSVGASGGRDRPPAGERGEDEQQA